MLGYLLAAAGMNPVSLRFFDLMRKKVKFKEPFVE